MNSISTARASDLMINWELAGTTAARVAPAGPRFSAAQVSQEVAALRSAAAEAVDHVHRITGLEAARNLGTDPAETLVVDRATWSKANVESFRELLGPALKIALEQKPELGEEGSNAQVFGSSFAGAELGAVLAYGALVAPMQQAWQAAVADIPLDDYAKNHPELAASIAKFSDGKDA